MTKPHQWCNQISVAVTAYSPEGQVIGTWNLAYDPSTLALTNETIVAGGEMSVLARTQDSFGRVSGFTLNDDYSISYGFAGDGRFSGLSSVIGHQSSNSWQYSYLQDSELISMISNQQSVTTTKSYENHRNLLTEVHNKSQSVTISKYQYENDALGRRTQRVDTTVSVITNDFGYDARSQLTNAVMGAENFAWAFDNIGNRETYTHPTGSGQATNLYTANELNQYTQISNGGLKTLTYDLDGNLVTDGTWSNVWNGENRPVLIEPMNPSNGSERVELAYDYQGRRIKEKISVYSGSAWSVVRTNFWLYDGWNPVQEVVLTASGTETNWWTHGLDLSGTLQGAGGIGGFLAWTRASDGKTFLYSGDANGNITELVDASNPTNIVASYQWDAYGDSISMFGSEAENNVFRWSSKYVIVQTGDKDYGYRILRDHRWLSRDPIGELGFRTQKRNRLLGREYDLYGYARNDPLFKYDPQGLKASPSSKKEVDPCEEAYGKLPVKFGERGTVICHNGKRFACVWNKDDVLYKRYPEILKCFQDHEDLHLRQRPNVKCRPCETYRIPSASVEERDSDECDAWEEPLKCFINGHKIKCGAEYEPSVGWSDKPSHCEMAFSWQIENAMRQRNKYCGRVRNTIP